jgi:protease I
MTDRRLEGVRVAVLAADGFEQVEVTWPVRALEKHGAAVQLVSLRAGAVRGMNLLVPGKRIRVDRTLAATGPDDFDALHLPGGFVGADTLRQSERALDLVRAFDRAGKPISALSHAPWVLISAGLVRGRRLTSWPGIRDDVRNAGGEWVDEEAVRDAHWLSGRGPRDLRAFDRAIVQHFAEHARAGAAAGESSWGRWIVGGLVAAAAGYAGREALRPRPRVIPLADRAAAGGAAPLPDGQTEPRPPARPALDGDTGESAPADRRP